MLRSKFTTAMTLCAIFIPFAVLAAACTEGGGSGDTDGATGGGSGSGSGSGSEGGSASDAGSGDSGTQGGEGSATGGGSALGPGPVVLGTAGDYVILAKSAISNVPTSVITGDLGLSPAAASYITGLDLTKAGVSWTSAQVIGDVYAADNDPPTPTVLTTAVADMQTAYTDAAGRTSADFLNLGAGAIGGLTLVPGLYRWTSTVTIPSDVTLAGQADAVWIFQITGDLKMSAGQDMILSGGARASNIVWQVAGAVDLGVMAHAEGIVMAKTGINLGTGASINGRLFAQTSVDIAAATVTAP